MLNIDDIDSDFLCKSCGKLIYVEPNNNDFLCCTRTCALYPTQEILNTTPALENRLSDDYNRIIFEMNKLDHANFMSFLFNLRSNLVKNFIEGSPLKYEDFLLYNEILRELAIGRFFGRKRATREFEKIIDMFRKYLTNIEFVENIKNKTFLMLGDKRVFIMNYWKGIRDFYENYGIISQKGAQTTFEYPIPDQIAAQKISFQFGKDDFSEFFNKHFSFVNATKYIFRRNYMTSQRYSYDADKIDVALFLGIFFSLRHDIENWPSFRLKDLVEKYKINFNLFLSKFVDSRERIPIILRVQNGFLIDKSSLLLFIFYLVGNLDTVSEMKTLAGRAFEDNIRTILRTAGFSVSDERVKLTKNNQEYEYDVIGVNEDNKKIFLIEAKYRDLSPSSISGSTILEQELYPTDDSGLVGRSLRQENRYLFFKENFIDFKKKLNLHGNSLNDYAISPIIVTKYIPLINRYKDVKLFNFENLRTIL